MSGSYAYSSTSTLSIHLHHITLLMLAVNRSGNVLVYNLDGEIVSRWNLGEECGSILDAYIWNGGLVVLSSSYRFYAVLNIVITLSPSTSSLVYVAKMEQTNQFSITPFLCGRVLGTVVMQNELAPKVRALPDARLETAPLCWTVIPPSLSVTRTLLVLVSVASGTILTVSSDGIKDHVSSSSLNYWDAYILVQAPGCFLTLIVFILQKLLSNGPFTRIVVSPSGKFIACFTQAGQLWVASTDFTKSILEFATGSRQVLLMM